MRRLLPIAAAVLISAVASLLFAPSAFAAFPTVGSATATQFATSVTSMAVNLPACSSGDLLISAVEVRNSGTFTNPTGWTDIASQVGGASAGKLSVFYHVCDGSEGSTATWTASVGTSAIWQVRKITSWHGTTAPEGSCTSGDVSAANPPSLSPSWGLDDNAWLAFAGHAAASTAAWSAGPSGYSDFLDSGASSGGAAVSLGSAYKTATASSEDPGAYTVSGSNRFWAACTVAVRPAAGGGSNSCTYAGTGNWDIKYSDNCYITGNNYVSGACNLLYDGPGSFGLAGTISCAGLHGSPGFLLQGLNGAAKIYTR